jgi:aryl-alcohol dehydrogenase-like predicted oxidoreductase
MIPVSPFGRTGHPSTRTIFGAAALGRVTQDEADRTLETLLTYGINHIDTAADYGDSELRIGPWMREHRAQFFLATKTGQRTAAGARESLHRSLERLRVDRVDLIQLHALVAPEEWETAMGPGGALEALVEAREQGLVRFIGVTGHGVSIPSMHLRSLGHFDFDAVLLPYNYPIMQNRAYAANFRMLTEICRHRRVAVQTIKSLARGPYPENQPHTHTTWYAPLDDPAAIEKAVHWVLSNPQVFLNTVGDLTLLPVVLAAASRYETGPEETAMQDLIDEQAMTPLFV